jgi:hypothetical protein
MSSGLATVVIDCAMVLTIVGVILKLVLDDIGEKDTCPTVQLRLRRK